MAWITSSVFPLLSTEQRWGLNCSTGNSTSGWLKSRGDVLRSWIWSLLCLAASLAKAFLKTSLPAYLPTADTWKLSKTWYSKDLNRGIALSTRAIPLNSGIGSYHMLMFFAEPGTLHVFSSPIHSLTDCCHLVNISSQMFLTKKTGILNNPRMTCIHKLKCGIKIRTVIVCPV